MQKIINTKAAPSAIGPYSQGKIFGNLIYASGQIPISAETGEVLGNTIEEQTRQVFVNIKGLLESTGSSLDKIIKTTVFLSDMENFAPMNQVYATYFNDGNFPARSTIEVARLPKDVLVEIEVIAQV